MNDNALMHVSIKTAQNTQFGLKNRETTGSAYYAAIYETTPFINNMIGDFKGVPVR